jgi:hypothetical protein
MVKAKLAEEKAARNAPANAAGDEDDVLARFAKKPRK